LNKEGPSESPFKWKDKRGKTISPSPTSSESHCHSPKAFQELDIQHCRESSEGCKKIGISY